MKRVYIKPALVKSQITLQAVTAHGNVSGNNNHKPK